MEPDITWLEGNSREDPDSLPEPTVVIAGIHDEMKAILRHFTGIAAGLGVELDEQADVDVLA